MVPVSELCRKPRSEGVSDVLPVLVGGVDAFWQDSRGDGILGPPRSVTPGLHLLPGDVTFRAWLRCLQTFSMGKTVK